MAVAHRLRRSVRSSLSLLAVFGVLAGCQMGTDPQPAVIVDPIGTTTPGAADVREVSTPEPTRTPFLLPPTRTPQPRQSPAASPVPGTPVRMTTTIASPAAAASHPSPPVATATQVVTGTPSAAGPVVRRVVDGETIEIEQAGVTQRVRLIGVSVPRSSGAGECWGDEALAHVRSLLPAGQAVRLVSEAQDRDDRGRLLRHLFVGDVSIGEAILADGAGVVSLEPPNTERAAALIKAQREAVDGARGLWRACPLAPEMVGPPAPVEVLNVTGAAAGGRASLIAQTAPGATCALAYTTPAGTLSRQAALVPRDADAGGRVAWEWPIARNTRPGTGRVRVTCRGISVSLPISIAPAAPTPPRG